MVEYKTGSSYVDDLTDTPIRLGADGMLAIRDRPGLGIVLDPDRLDRYTNAKELLKY